MRLEGVSEIQASVAREKKKFLNTRFVSRLSVSLDLHQIGFFLLATRM